jgi:hypothetical protein
VRSRSSRVLPATAALLLGVAVCFVMDAWAARHTSSPMRVVGDLVLALPFAGLAAMIVGGMSRIASAVGWLVLASLTVFAYIEDATTESSTASLVFLAPFIWGGVAISIIFAGDRIIRDRRARRLPAAQD